MELVTGRAGSPHITAQQDRQKHQGIWGDGAYILATGNQLEPEVQSSNKILIKDGALMFQGALFSVKVGTTDEITINNGNQGMQRKDLVVARYTYNSAEQKESAEWVVIQGTPAASNPVAPTGTDGDIQVGDSTVDCPFMIVNLNGINVTGVDIIPEKIPTLPDLIGNIGIKIVDVLYANLIYPTGDTPQTIHTCSGTVTSQKDLTGCKFACSFVNGNYVSPQANPVVNLSGKSTLNISQMYRNISDGTHSFGATVLVICYK